jgi:hypothetical protein
LIPGNSCESSADKFFILILFLSLSFAGHLLSAIGWKSVV